VWLSSDFSKLIRYRFRFHVLVASEFITTVLLPDGAVLVLTKEGYGLAEGELSAQKVDLVVGVDLVVVRRVSERAQGNLAN
jgi:hypothetical protein